jgi:ketosteroid isomerase-like protein
MDISASRDFGISTGPWEAQEYRPNTAPVATGYYLTVWKKQSDGAWKAILDGGSATPVPVENKHIFLYPAGADKKVSDPPVIEIESSCKELSEREKQILTEWRKNPGSSAYTSFLEKNIRLQINGHLPTTNADTIRTRIDQLDKKMIWNSAGSGAASSGDIGYTYGLLEIPGNPDVIKGHYVRIWKKHPGADWKIIMEMMNID